MQCLLTYKCLCYFAGSCHSDPETQVKLDKLTRAKLSLDFKVYQGLACLRFIHVKTRASITSLSFPCADSFIHMMCIHDLVMADKAAAHHTFSFFCFSDKTACCRKYSNMQQVTRLSASCCWDST